MLAAMIVLTSAVFYFGTVGVLDRHIDAKIRAISDRLIGAYGIRPLSDLTREIDRELTDGIDSDSEIFLVTSLAGQRIVGNLSGWPAAIDKELGRLIDARVIRNGTQSSARLFVRALPQGGWLYVGRDLSDEEQIRDLVWHALETALALALVLVVISAYVFRHRIESRIADIRRTAHEIEAGHLNQRIQMSGEDEFARLGHDINRMLDRIEHLMNGVRQVSNAIAHDLRTPLSRLRSQLDESLRSKPNLSTLSEATRTAIEHIDGLIVVFNKLLQIAEAESGMRTAALEAVDLGLVVRNMVDLYDAAAEEQNVRLQVSCSVSAWVQGDHDLLASAVASLIDNAIKYAGAGSTVELSILAEADGPALTVQDDGPGVPDEELPKLTTRFYRLDRSRSQPGNGLGLAIVSAIATLHGASMRLTNAYPGFRASIHFPLYARVRHDLHPYSDAAAALPPS
jgi:signal transduction histidine kinase